MTPTVLANTRIQHNDYNDDDYRYNDDGYNDDNYNDDDYNDDDDDTTVAAAAAAANAVGWQKMMTNQFSCCGTKFEIDPFFVICALFRQLE